MKAIVIYDSLYGNTEKIAQAIGEQLQLYAEIVVQRVTEVKLDQLACDLLVVGSPTQRFNPTVAMNDFLNSIPRDGLNGMKVAAFDTRLTWEEIEKSPPLPFFEKIFGYAAQRIAKKLVKKGGRAIVAGEGFFVAGMEGPLIEGEVERARSWADKLFA